MLLFACSTEGRTPFTEESSPSRTEPAIRIAFFGDQDDPRYAQLLKGAEAAASQSKARIEKKGQPAGRSLAGVTNESFIGALTIGGTSAIAEAGAAIESASFPVIELSSDPYESGVLEHSVMQAPPPHTWQAWRLARYFGRGDRGYRVVGLIRPPGAEGDALSAVTAMRMSERDIDLIDSVLPASDAVTSLRARRPEAVIVAGTSADLEQVVAAMGPDGAYAGRARVKDGWRPQLAGFESTWGTDAPAGTVIASDYAMVWNHPSGVVGPDPVREAAGKIEPKSNFATLFELRGYEAARVLLDGATRAGAGPGPLAPAKRAEIFAAIESFDRLRLGRLPVSFGPDDRVIAERDHMGLWAAVADPSAGSLFQPLMRTFTSDLERTNVLEEDWPYFFEGAVPGAEAPFFHQSKFGIVTDKSDDLH